MRSWTLALLLLAACGGGSRRAESDEHRSQGDALFDRREYVGAIEHYEEALRKSPDQPGALLRLGLCWERLGMTNRAIECYERLLKAAPKCAEAATARERIGQIRALEQWDPEKGPTPEVILD